MSVNTKWPTINTRPQKKTKKIYIIRKKGRQKTSLAKRDQEAAVKKSGHDRTS